MLPGPLSFFPVERVPFLLPQRNVYPNGTSTEWYYLSDWCGLSSDILGITAVYSRGCRQGIFTMSVGDDEIKILNHPNHYIK